MQTIIWLLTFNIIILSALSSIALIFTIVVLLMFRRSIKRLNLAIDNVEDTAIRTLEPFMDLKFIFSDLGRFFGFFKRKHKKA